LVVTLKGELKPRTNESDKFGSHSADFKKAPLTVETKINFLAPVVSGPLIAEARIVHKGQTISLSDVEVKDDKGRDGYWRKTLQPTTYEATSLQLDLRE
jgi:hypothetical protein